MYKMGEEKTTPISLSICFFIIELFLILCGLLNLFVWYNFLET